ncbi:monooxygenase [Neolentinus lepideus HHB14362 ss-1]|uniref:Monooxygenase n=1 Tax=Neolentinus lepideus HHB14362 ss-1 TaxID=1314782 RepID=A0A165NVN8_9AGAM|nr:monooxygenase [Neolentinus lepideus HHB14362 ss-1]
MASQSLPIFIVGAGPTGLVLALTLRQSGVPVRIIDKVSKPHVGSRGAGIMPRTLEVYNYLGVLPDVLKSAVPLPVSRMYKLPGGTEVMKEFSRSPRTHSTPGIPFFNSYILGQDVAQAILRSHLEKYNCHVEFNTELGAFEQHSDYVQIHLVRHEGGNETPETFSAAYLVGADGAKGVVRKLLGLSFDGETRQGYSIVLADVKLRGLPRDAWHMWGDMATRGFWAMPRFTHDDDTFWITISGRDVDHDKLASEPETLKTFVKEFTNRPEIEIAEFLTLGSVRFNIRMVSEFSRGRVFIAGDAAHVHSPAGGQGMNSSVMDAFNLAWKLSLAYKGLASANLLQSYNDERKPVIQNMLKFTTEIFDKTLAGKSKWERGREFYQLDVSYRGSPIVVDKRQVDALTAPQPNIYTASLLGTVQAGDRAPDAPSLVMLKDSDTLSPITSLFKIFKPTKHTVLILSPLGPAADSVLDALQNSQYPSSLIQTVTILPVRVAVREKDVLPRTDLVLKDADGHVYEGYSVDPWKNELTVVVVRPDGIVGGIGAEVQTVTDYFERILS